MTVVPEARKVPAGETPEALHARIRLFLGCCREPVLIEPGETPVPLGEGSYALDLRAGRVILEAWGGGQYLSRRVLAVAGERRGEWRLKVERFGGHSGEVVLADLAERRGGILLRRAGTAIGEDLLQRFLSRQFGGWRVSDCTAGQDLTHSLSSSFPRAFVQQGLKGWAALLAPPTSIEAECALAYGLLWLDYLRRRGATVQGLAVFLPAGRHLAVALRMQWLDPEKARCRLFLYDERLLEEEVDPRDCGNFEDVLPPARSLEAEGLLEHSSELKLLSQERGIEICRTGPLEASIRAMGLEIGRWSEGRLLQTLDGSPRKASTEVLLQLAATVIGVRSGHERHPWRDRNPEAWLEWLIAQDPRKLDSSLCTGPVYRQVLSWAGMDRGILDLLTVGGDGRLAVVEVKTSEDLQLPMQALDYWMRVRRHAVAGEFAHQGYFQGRSLRTAAPRLLLVAPALQFHPTSETLLGMLRSDVEVERLGLSVEWQKELRVVLRLKGAARPEW